MYTFERQAYEERTRWFQEARFGLFLHWGLYSIPARGEWVRNSEEMPEEAYMPFFREFDPVDFDPVKWARLAKEAGMRYAVLTAKHHDGFCLFDSALTDFKSTRTPCGRDLVKEFLDAFRAEGLKVGLYYSLLDWHHPDYPHYGDLHHPMRHNPECGNEERDFNRYLTYLHGQVRELCENYGKLDIMWFDFSYGDMRAETWKGHELVDMVRRLQPGILIDNRLEASGEGFGSLTSAHPQPCHGDFVTPETMIPPYRLRNELGEPVVWESCITMNNHWGYCANDRSYKSASLLIRKLVECVSKGGNMLLNVGPDARGNFPEQSVQILQGIGTWMKKNRESIYGCTASDLPKPEYGRITQCGNVLYYHLFEPVLGPVPLTGIRPEQLGSIRLLSDGHEIPVSHHWCRSSYPQLAFADLGEEPLLPDETDTVLKVTLKEEPA